jgi:hypothetical protein
MENLTFGQKAVGLTFNPSGNVKVDNVKRKFAEIIDMVEDITVSSYLGNTLKGMAIRACIAAQMSVVKYLTYKD